MAAEKVGMENTPVEKAEREKILGAGSAKNLAKVGLALSYALLLFALAFVSYYLWGPSRGEFHSDCTDTIMWAQASFEGKTILNPDFDYACFLPFGGQWLMVPLIAVFGVSMTTQLLGMTFFLLLLTGALLFLFRSLRMSAAAGNVATALILIVLSASPKLRETFWGHIIYYSLGVFLLCVGLGLVIRAIDSLERCFEKKNALCYGLMIFVWFALSATNQLTALTIFLVPVIGAMILEPFFRFGKAKEGLKARCFVGLVAIVGTVLGYMLGSLIIGGQVAAYQDAFSIFAPSKLWFQHASLFLAQWPTLLGVSVSSEALLSAEGMTGLWYLVYSFALIAAPVALTLLYPKIKQREGRLLIWTHWILTALIWMGYVFSYLSETNWRLSPLLFSSLLMTAYLAHWLLRHSQWKRAALIPLLPVAIAAVLTAQSVFGLPTRKEDYGNRVFYDLAEFLEKNDLNYGYGTFWNANSITVISGSKVKVRPCVLSDESFKPRHYQSQKSWYGEQPGQSKYFLLISGAEYGPLFNSHDDIYYQAIEELEAPGEYTVLVFDHPPFEAELETETETETETEPED